MNRLPRSIWALGVVSLFMDASSEMIHALLPAYLVAVLGASALTVGIIEGIAEATANVAKVFSGVLSDRFARRKPLVIAGYGVAAATKPVFALAGTIAPIFAARFVDRIGKGIRGAPRDALIADIAPVELRATSFGLRQALDTVGAIAGPLIAIGLMILTGDSFRAVFWFAAIPAVIAVLVLLLAVREPRRERARSTIRPPLLSSVRELGRPFWGVAAVASMLALARFSEAFLILRAQDTGLRLALVPVVLVVMNVAYAATSYPAGRLADNRGRRGVLIAGIVILVAADLLLAVASTVSVTIAGVALWGLHMGFTQGIFSAMVADTAPAAKRGSAYGTLNLAVGIATFFASIIAGALWDTAGPASTFLAGALLAALALAALLIFHPSHAAKR